jgi:AcrR family transcriptional regulator
MQRKIAILQSANLHFASHGFRGASLRDIARDAKVSLTLLNHHFGSKLDLLGAVVDAHRGVIERRILLFESARRSDPPPPTLSALLAQWVAELCHDAREADGRMFQRLLLRLLDDAETEATALIRARLEGFASSFVGALRALHPQASRRAVALAYVCTTSTALRLVTSMPRVAELAGEEPPAEGEVPADDQARLVKLLVAGAEAALRD